MIVCPDCGTRWPTETREPCPGCGMPVDDLETAADFLLEQEER